MNRIEGPWCRCCNYWGGKVWFFVDNLFVCDDFWPHFEWERPKPREEMRLVFSTKNVKGAQKTLIRNDEWGRMFIIKPRVNLGMFRSMRILLCELEPRRLYEFYVWWWPEYRDGESK